MLDNQNANISPANDRILSDEAAREQALDTGQSVCVTAPAGSGKTELLTQRYLCLLAEVERPEQILAITFTRKARTEMLQRIVQALHMGRQETPPEAAHQQRTWALAKRALQQDAQNDWYLLQNPARLRLQTIDGLCQSIASDQPVLSELGGGLQPVDNASVLYEKAVDQFLLELESGAAIAEDIGRLLLHLDNNVVKLRQLLMMLLPLRDQWLSHAVSYSGTDDAQSVMEATLNRWVEQELSNIAGLLQPVASELCLAADFAANQLSEAGDKHSRSPITSLAGIVELPAADIQELNRWKAIVQLLCTKDGSLRKRLDKSIGFPAKSATKDKQLAAEYALRKERMQAIIGDLAQRPNCVSALNIVASLPEQSYQPFHWEILRPLTECLVRVCAHLRMIFGQTGQCDHNEIASSALRALQAVDNDSSDIKFRWDMSLRHILVDEFQDTSVSQFELLKALTKDWSTVDSTDTVAQRSVFIVGDGMQSIYGFRAAKVGLFLTAKNYGIGDLALRSIDLVRNFRSTSGIVEWINSHFQSAFPDSVDISRGAVPYSWSRSAVADTSVNPLPASEAVSVIGCVEEGGRQGEAQQVVAAIADARRDKPSVDIAILVRSRGHLRDILPALEEAGITWQGVDLDPLQSREVIMDCMTLTRALCYPADTLAWMALLRGPWCGLSLADLQRLVDGCAADNRFQSGVQNVVSTLLGYVTSTDPVPQLAGVSLSDEGATRFRVFAGRLQAIWRERGRKPLRQWLESAWRSLGGAVLACHSSAGDDNESAMAFFDLLEQIDQQAAISQQRFSIELLTERLNSLYASQQVGGVDADALQRPVQIMTIHKSKGLEFDTVIVPGLDRASRADDKPLLAWNEHLFDDGDSGLVLCPLDAVTQRDASAGLYQFLIDENRRVSRFESTRLLYVAATRARSRLLLLANVRPEKNGEFKAPASNSLLAHLWQSVRDELQVHCYDEDIEENEVEPEYLLLKRFSLAVVEEIFGEQHLAQVTGQDLSEQQVRENVSATSDISGDSSKAGELPQLAGRQVAAQIGTCIHEIYELIAHQGLLAWQNNELADRHSAWRFRLLQLGVPESDLAESLEIVAVAVQTLAASEQGEWLLNPAHKDTRSEWRLASLDEAMSVDASAHLLADTDISSDTHPDIATTKVTAKGEVNYYVIDRSFIDEKQCRWIVDYKITQPEAQENVEDFIRRQCHRYRQQLVNYQNIVGTFDKQFHPSVVESRCALYFPLFDRLVEVSEHNEAAFTDVDCR